MKEREGRRREGKIKEKVGKVDRKKGRKERANKYMASCLNSW